MTLHRRKNRSIGEEFRVRRLNPRKHYPRLVKEKGIKPMLVCRNGDIRFLFWWEQILIKFNASIIRQLDKTKY